MKLSMYVSLHSPRALFAQRSAAPDPPLGKICATLDGVRRLQRLGYREGLYLCRANARKSLSRRAELIIRAGVRFPATETKDGAECRYDGSRFGMAQSAA